MLKTHSQDVLLTQKKQEKQQQQQNKTVSISNFKLQFNPDNKFSIETYCQMLRIFEKINELIKIVIYYRTKYHFNYLIKEDQPKFVISLYSCPQKLVKK